MLRLSITEMISKIGNEEPFYAVSDDYSFTLKIEEYTYFLCGAVHDGHQFRKELWEHCLHTAYERWYEEDPCTRQMVQSNPMVIAGMDSRFEYDLNRAPETAIYEDAYITASFAAFGAITMILGALFLGHDHHHHHHNSKED